MAANELTPEEKIAAKKAADRIRMARWRKDNPEENRIRQRRSYEAHRDARTESYREYRAKNAERIREYYRGRKPQMAANAKQFRENEANRMTLLANTARARAKRMGLECDGLKELRRAPFPPECACCHCALDRSRKNRDRSPTLDRHDTAKGYVMGNIRVICHRCNRLKSDATIEELEAILAYMRG